MRSCRECLPYIGRPPTLARGTEAVRKTVPTSTASVHTARQLGVNQNTPDRKELQIWSVRLLVARIRASDEQRHQATPTKNIVHPYLVILSFQMQSTRPGDL